jgi:hypothetical protein
MRANEHFNAARMKLLVSENVIDVIALMRVVVVIKGVVWLLAMLTLALMVVNQIRDAAHAVVEALGLEQTDAVVEGLATRWQKGTLIMQPADRTVMLRRKNKLWVHHGRAQAPLSRAVETIREERVRSLSQARLH